MSKMIMVGLWVLVGLALLVGGATGMTALGLEIAGILVIIGAIVMAWKMNEMKEMKK